MTLQIFLHFFHHKFVTSHSSTSLPQPTALRRCATNLTALPLTPPRRYPSPRRIADALLTSRLCLSLPHIATPANGASEMRYSLETPFVRSAAEDAWGYCRHTLSRRFGDALLLQRRSLTARAVSPSVNPRQRRGHTHRCRCVADAPPLTHPCPTSTAAPPCGAYLPLHSIPGRTVRG